MYFYCFFCFKRINFLIGGLFFRSFKNGFVFCCLYFLLCILLIYVNGKEKIYRNIKEMDIDCLSYMNVIGLLFFIVFLFLLLIVFLVNLILLMY